MHLATQRSVGIFEWLQKFGWVLVRSFFAILFFVDLIKSDLTKQVNQYTCVVFLFVEVFDILYGMR